MRRECCDMEESSDNKKDDELEAAKAEMSQALEENHRLKQLLERVEEDYRCLQLRLSGILQEEAGGHLSKPSTQEPDMVSLSLGMSSRDQEKPTSLVSNGSTGKDDLNLGVDSRSEIPKSPSPSPKLSLGGEAKAAREREECLPKTTTKKHKVDDEVSQSQHVHAKRARVCVRARCDTPTMNDGCQWRKYGQKISKGNPCPRAYYRCTVAPTCPVRKQVQRCADDMSILITTYEGTHNHPLSTAGSTMASTTSAAASMLLSESSTSNQVIASCSSPEAHGLNFSLSNDARQKQIFLPIPTAPPLPTVTLDLTAGSSSSSATEMSPGFNSAIPSASLSFGSSESNILPSLWGMNGGHMNSYALPQASHGTDLTKRPGKQSYSSLEKNQAAGCTQHELTQTLTNAITSDPSFRTAIATAISNMMGSNESGKRGDVTRELLALNSKDRGYPPALSFVPYATSQTPTLTQVPLPYSIFNSSSSFTNQNHLG